MAACVSTPWAVAELVAAAPVAPDLHSALFFLGLGLWCALPMAALWGVSVFRLSRGAGTKTETRALACGAAAGVGASCLAALPIARAMLAPDAAERSSTAVVGFLFLPAYALPASVFVYGILLWISRPARRT